jgi:transcriptional regulator with XRE-family HTH domain
MKGSTTDNDKRVAAKIRSRRLRLGLSQKQVGAHLGVSYQQFQNYERGESRISAGNLQKLCDLLKVSTDFLFEEVRPTVKPSANPHALSAMQQQLLNDFDSITDPTLRASILHLVSAIAVSCGATQQLVGGGAPGANTTSPPER